MAKVLVNESSLTGIADAIRGKNGSTDTYKPSEMAAAITAISGGGGSGVDIPDEAFVISGDCNYWNYNGKWNELITACADKWSTNNITNCSNMFYNSKILNIPFEINLKNNSSLSLLYMLTKTNITTAPIINGDNVVCTNMGYLFYDSEYLKHIPDNFFDFCTITTSTNMTFMFNCCYSLRTFPSSINTLITPALTTAVGYTLYRNMTGYCYVLDQITNLGVYTSSKLNINAFIESFYYCSRLKNIIFALQDNGTPYVVNWKNQAISLSSHVGYSPNTKNILNYNSGITADKEVTDDTTYQALKDDPDWWTTDIAYSRYNHDSAVATINSLPDTSAYLASAGGTNTISFKGSAGSATDGGAINTLTEEEIAVATAKGWSVSLT